MGWIGCVHCEKFRCDFVAQTCALIAPFQPVLHLALSINETLPNAPKHYETHQNRVSCSNERFPNAPKHYETHQNRSLGSNWVYRVHSLRKLPMRLHATNLCINSTISAHFASSFVQQRNNPKCNQTLQNEPKHAFRVQWGWIGCVHCVKFRCDFMAQTCALIAPVQPILHRVSCSNETLPNAP